MLSGHRVFVVSLLLGVTGWPAAAQNALSQAKILYQRTEYEKAITLLNAEVPKSAEVWLVLGKCHYGMADFAKAVEAIENATQIEPEDSQLFNWLGKAYGRKAETASIFSAPGLARKARENFEKAVALDPKNTEAISDLFEYYLAAPGFLGGGTDKAAALAERMAVIDAAQGRYLQARLAEKDKKFDVVERNLREAAELAPKQVGRLLDLARYLSRTGKTKESDHVFAKAESLAPGSPKVKFAKAAAYLDAKRNLPEARELLQEYLASTLTPDDPPREQAVRLLKAASGG